jgi:diketogulonate reductase-like aldo/keto reductase
MSMNVTMIGSRLMVQHYVYEIAEKQHRDRIAENSRIFDFELTGEELAQLDALDRTGKRS